MIEQFGITFDGKPVERLSISNDALSANIISWGAIVQDLRLAGVDHPLVLGFSNFDDYPQHSPYFGAIAGRYANRIAGGKFSIDGVQYQADKNFLGKHLLHGGAAGIGKQNWTIADHGNSHVELHFTEADGSNGFPGDLSIQCRYEIEDENRLVITLNASTNKPTPCNLAHHSYFNLDGTETILDHSLKVNAETYLPVDDELIPTGEVATVENSAFDFRNLRKISKDPFKDYDHNFCCRNSSGPVSELAQLESEKSGLRMSVFSTEPGLQVYTGGKLNTPVNGLTGRPYTPYAGIALEPQVWPDSPNNPSFPQAVLRPGETYHQKTIYQFSMNTDQERPL